MTLVPPHTTLEVEQGTARQADAPRDSAHSVSPERIVVGVLLAAAGGAWLLDEVGVSVPWVLAPAVVVDVDLGAGQLEVDHG